MSVKSSRSMFLVLRKFASERRPLGAGEIARCLGLPMTTTLRILATLEAAGYAERNRSTSQYRLGKAAHTLAFAFLSQFPIHNLALPYLQRLTLETRQTSSLFVRIGWSALRAATVLGQGSLINNTPVGESRRLVSTAPSLAILSNLAAAEAERAIARGAADADDAKRIRIETARHRGAASVAAASPSGSGAADVAWPLLDDRGQVIAAVAVEGVPEKNVQSLIAEGSVARQILEELAAAATREISAAISHYDHVDPDEVAFAAGPRSS